jgi:hypothetical protein
MAYSLCKLYLKGTAQPILIRNIVKYKSFPLPDLDGESFVPESELMQRVLGMWKGVRHRLSLFGNVEGG